jgi:hypothetical protein
MGAFAAVDTFDARAATPDASLLTRAAAAWQSL